jgi:hypothetical protein
MSSHAKTCASWGYESCNCQGVTFYVPTKLVSEANMREHWAIKNKRKKAQQRAVELVWLAERVRVAPPVVVTLTRVGVRKLDSDNLAGSAKGVRDQIAKLIGVDDGDERKVRWIYEQRKGVPKQYGLEVRIVELEPR